MRYSFSNIEIDTERFELRRDGELCSAEPKVFDLLVILVRHPGQVLNRDMLVEKVWGGRPVAETTISTCIKHARRLLGDTGNTQRFIKTLRGRGYCFDADVRVDDNLLTEPPAPAAARRGDAAATPALLVMPLRAVSETGMATQLAQTLAAGLTTLLGRIPLLRLAVHPGTGNEKTATPSARALHEEYAVDYVLDGTVLYDRDRYRIQIQLADARSGFLCWSGQFVVDGPFDSAVHSAPLAIITKLEPQLHRAIAADVDGDNTDPQRLFLAAHSLLSLKGWRHEAFDEAAALLRRSRELAPDFALAPALLSLVIGFGDRIRLIDERERTRAEALEAAQTALSLDDMDSTVLGYAGCAIADIGDGARALPILRQAVELNPGNAQAWVALGSVNVLNGQFETGVEQLSHGIDISPLDSRLAIWGTLLTVALLAVGRPDDALREARLACQRDDRCFLPRLALAGALLVTGAESEAIESLRSAVRIKPDLSREQIDAVVGRRLGVALARLQRNTR